MGKMNVSAMTKISKEQRKSWKTQGERISDRGNRSMGAEIRGLFREQQ